MVRAYIAKRQTDGLNVTSINRELQILRAFCILLRCCPLRPVRKAPYNKRVIRPVPR
jgi:hypothetical protein